MCAVNNCVHSRITTASDVCVQRDLTSVYVNMALKGIVVIFCPVTCVVVSVSYVICHMVDVMPLRSCLILNEHN